jgi:hypothetical protein
MNMTQTLWVNPFASFLSAARLKFRKIVPEPGVNADATLVPRLVKMREDRSFVFDIVDRVQTLATALDRLRELFGLYVLSDDQRSQLIEAQRADDPARLEFEVPDELECELNQCHLEAQVLVAFAYYELTTLTTLLRCWFAPSPESHLEYLVGVRNKILAHPRRDARVKNSTSALTIGPILHAHLVGADGWTPLIRDWYLKEMTVLGSNLDFQAGTAANVTLIRDRTKKVEKLTREEQLRLKTYGIPEPNLLESASEMAALLSSNFLPEIERVCTERVSQ